MPLSSPGCTVQVDKSKSVKTTLLAHLLPGNNDVEVTSGIRFHHIPLRSALIRFWVESRALGEHAALMQPNAISPSTPVGRNVDKRLLRWHCCTSKLCRLGRVVCMGRVRGGKARQDRQGNARQRKAWQG